MFKDLSILSTATLMARYAVERHAVISENIANADTPGFKAKDLEPFSEAFKSGNALPSGALANRNRARPIETTGVASPNGNTVSLEDQMARGGEVARDHQTAVTIYTRALAMLRTSLGR